MKYSLPLSQKELSDKFWQAPADLTAFKEHALIPLLANEAGRMAASMPLVVSKGNLVALCGVECDFNLFIDLKGLWLGASKPLWFETYPFHLQVVGDKAIPCFDRRSGWLTEAPEGGSGSLSGVRLNRFYDDNSQLAEPVKLRIDKLVETYPGLVQTQNALNALKQAGLLRPLPEHLVEHYGLEIKDLLTFDERALAKLTDEQFLALRKTGAIALGYAMSFSLGQFHLIERLVRLTGRVKKSSDQDFDAFFDSGDDTLKF